MARKPRVSNLEKMTEELQQIKELISAETQKLNSLKDREKELSESIIAEQTRQILSMMEEKRMSMDELKSLINNYTPDNMRESSTHGEVA